MDLKEYLIKWLQKVHGVSGLADLGARDIQIRAQCAAMRQSLIEYGSDRGAVESLLRSLVGQNAGSWLQLMDRYQVFQGVGAVEPQFERVTKMPQPTTAPAYGGGLVRMPQQQPQAQTQATAIQRSPAGAIEKQTPGDVLPVLVRGTKILDQIAATDLSLFISGASNSGKSTLARALVLAIHRQDPDAEFYICEPQDETWLGLERYRSIVRTCTFDELEIPATLLREAYYTSETRYKARQQMLHDRHKTGDVEPPNERCVWVIVNEWNNIFDTWNELPAAERKERGINDMLLHARSIIRAGRKVNVRLVLLGQEHTKQSTGLSTQIKKSMGFVSTGLLLPSGNGGYSSILGLIKDGYLLEKHQQEVLYQVYQEAVRDRTPLLATTLGMPRIAELPNFSGVKRQNILGQYKHKPMAEYTPSTRPTPLNLEYAS